MKKKIEININTVVVSKTKEECVATMIADGSTLLLVILLFTTLTDYTKFISQAYEWHIKYHSGDHKQHRVQIFDLRFIYNWRHDQIDRNDKYD